MPTDDVRDKYAPYCNAVQLTPNIAHCMKSANHFGDHSSGVTTWPNIPALSSSVAVPPAEAADECPWPVGTVLRSNGESGVFTWVFEHAVEGQWYEVGKGDRQDWAYVASFPNLVELVPSCRTDNDIIAEIAIRYLEAEPGENATDVYGDLVHAVMVVKHRTEPEWAPREEAS